MPDRDSQKTSLDVAVELSIYDLFKNSRGPKHSELWSIFTRSNPRTAGAALAFANSYSEDPKIRDAMLTMAAKLAAFYLPDSSFSPTARLEQVRLISEQFIDEVA